MVLHPVFYQLLKPLGFEVVVSRTFKNLRSRGNPVLVVPQVLKSPRFEVGRRRRV